MSNLSVNTITDALGGSTASINGLTPQASNMQPYNILINGGLDIWQRGTSIALNNQADAYSADRWAGYANGGVNVNYTQQAGSYTANGKNNSIRVQRDAGSSGRYYLYQMIETSALNKCRGKTVTVSFVAKRGADLGATSVVFRIGTKSSESGWDDSPVEYVDNTLSLSTSWQTYTYSFTLTSTSDAANGFFVAFVIEGVGGANVWYEVSQLQMEIGSTASSFAHENYGDTLQKCQRYYYRIKATSTNYPFGLSQCFSTTLAGALIPFPVTMRIAPSALEQSGTATDYQLYQASGSVQTCSSVPVYASVLTTPATGAVNWIVTSNIVSGNVTTAAAATSSAYLAWSAEL
jgi:hypothetical protein